jgi:hypothetical protein
MVHSSSKIKVKTVIIYELTIIKTLFNIRGSVEINLSFLDCRTYLVVNLVLINLEIK